MNNSRRAAAFAFARWRATGEYPAQLLGAGADRAFVQDLVYTAIRRLRPLRSTLGALMPRGVPGGELEALLFIGAAQILYMEGVPDFAAVNETVNAAKSAGGNPALAKVVNGVLRNLIRRKEELLARLAAAPLAERESFPSALVRRWSARFGEERAEELCRWHNRPAETFLARPDGSFVTLERGKSVADTPGYAAGEFIVQDPGTALATAMVEAQPGEQILDACAAPGGKTIQLCWRGAAVTACEVNPARRRRLEENLARTRQPAEVVGSFDAVAERRFAKILVDAPCSNTGVLRRRPDARWNWNDRKLAEVVKLQAEILDRVTPLLAPDGVLVYSTCSNEPEENQRQVESFLARHPEFTLERDAENLPFESATDGAYAARLRQA